jgi:hypothetical protein
MRTIPLFLCLEGTSFAVAGLVHGGVLLNGFQDQPASIAESSIAIVLLVGFALTQSWPSRTRLIGLAAQTVALLGTLLGAFVIAIGIGPRTLPDILFHATMLGVLSWGLVVTARTPADRAVQRVTAETLRRGQRQY